MNRARAHKRSLFAALLLSSLLACGDDADSIPRLDARTGTLQSLADRTFLLQSAQGYTPVAGTSIRLGFQGGALHASAGCNGMQGEYRIDGGALVIEGLGSTAIGCARAHAEQDAWLAGLLQARPALVLTGNTLTLTTPDVTLQFLDRAVADPDRPLVGVTWTVDSYITRDAVSAYADAVHPTVRFEADGTVQASSGCNTARGTYRVDGTRITLMGLAYTERGCDFRNIEGHVQAVLRDGTLTLAIEANRLTLSHGELGLSARAP